MDAEKQKRMVTFLDSVNRTIIAEKIAETDGLITVKNPVVVTIMPTQTGQMSLQLIPLFFREFLADKSAGIEWIYKRENITETAGEVVFDFKLYAQYEQLFSNSNIIIPQNAGTVTPTRPGSDNNVIKLFDD